MFVPPLNLGGFQPSPATLAQWVYQIWQYLQENPIATEEQLKEYIGTFITTSPETQTMIGEGVEQYLTENPPTAPVQSVQGKTGAVQLAYNEIVPASNAVPVYKASSTPSTNTLAGQYNLGYRIFVNTATQEIFTISPAGALSLVGRGKFDGTTVDLNSAQGDTTLAEAIGENASNIQTNTDSITELNDKLSNLLLVREVSVSATLPSNQTFVAASATIPNIAGYDKVGVVGFIQTAGVSSVVINRAWIQPSGELAVVFNGHPAVQGDRPCEAYVAILYARTGTADPQITSH